MRDRESNPNMNTLRFRPRGGGGACCGGSAGYPPAPWLCDDDGKADDDDDDDEEEEEDNVHPESGTVRRRGSSVCPAAA